MQIQLQLLQTTEPSLCASWINQSLLPNFPKPNPPILAPAIHYPKQNEFSRWNITIFVQTSQNVTLALAFNIQICTCSEQNFRQTRSTMNNIYIDKRSSGSSREARHRRIDVTLVTLTEDNAIYSQMNLCMHWVVSNWMELNSSYSVAP